MGQQKNNAQSEILFNFMRKHPELAKNFTKGDKVVRDALWHRLVKQLNAAGPPVKTIQAWKKSWADWKANIINRLDKNKASLKRTGSGHFNRYVLSPMEKSIAAMCGIYKAVDGIEGTNYSARKQNQSPTTANEAICDSPPHNSSVKSDSTPYNSMTSIAKEDPEESIYWEDGAQHLDAIAQTSSVGTTNSRVICDSPPHISMASTIKDEPEDIMYMNEDAAQLSEAGDQKLSSVCTDNSRVICESSPHNSTAPTAKEYPEESMYLDDGAAQHSEANGQTSSCVCTPRASKRRKSETLQDLIGQKMNNVENAVSRINQVLKENGKCLKNLEHHMKELHHLKQMEIDEIKRHNYVMEKSIQTSNELKREAIKLKKIKLGITE